MPVKCKFAPGELERFHAAYCGLCHSLKAHYTTSARFILNYDFTFLAILLNALSDQENKVETRRCIVSPFRKKSCQTDNPIFRKTAEISVIFAYWKLSDSVQDARGFGKILPKIAQFFFTRPYEKAKKEDPAFAHACKKQMDALQWLEREKSAELDLLADCFAVLLKQLACFSECPEQLRILGELFYHMGRWIYLVDAVHDLPDDLKKRRFNPLIYRFSLDKGAFSKEDKDWMRATIAHSHSRICAAFHLLELKQNQNLLENMLYVGMPGVSNEVFAGTFRKKHRKDTQR